MTDNSNIPLPPQRPAHDPARVWEMWCHLSALAGYVIPFGNILGPLIIWQMKKHEFPSLEAHGRAAINFQLTVTIAVIVGLLAVVPLSFICIGYLLIPVVVGITVAGLVFAIIAGIKANDGQEYAYPCTLHLV